MQKKSLISILLLLFLSSLSFAQNSSSHPIENYYQSLSSEARQTEIVSILRKAYPDTFKNLSDNEVLVEDGIGEKSFDQLLNEPDPFDMFHFQYPNEYSLQIAVENFDPGRIRNMAFFKTMYGGTEQEILKNIVAIDWLPDHGGGVLYVTSVNDVHLRLREISEELSQLSPELRQYILPSAGAFNFRAIAGTSRLSPHSFGIAIDINPQRGRYWRWDMNEPEDFVYENRLPALIVDIFERHGFIWGGKWYHYDSFHFEYRPELLIAAGYDLDFLE